MTTEQKIKAALQRIAELVNFQRSLTISEQGDFDELIDELDDCYLKITLQQKEQLKMKIDKKWGRKK